MSDRTDKSGMPVEAPGCHVAACPMRAPYCTRHSNRIRIAVYAARKAVETYRQEWKP
jgi:hypothetical protein